ncbi:MAG: hypothetical protein FWH36_02540 [Lentimicrobiaceae bacterium]|nr:hypothetical protein [Lentimicrobiaceae bacterium]
MNKGIQYSYKEYRPFGKTSYRSIRILTYFIVITLLISSCALKTYTKKQRTKEGIVYYYYNNGRLTETRNTKDGVRDGITENIYEDGEEYMRKVVIYERGIIQEENYYTRDSILLYKMTYTKSGEFIGMTTIRDIDSASNVHHIKTIDIRCRRIQYHLINNVVVDSIIFDR